MSEREDYAERRLWAKRTIVPRETNWQGRAEAAEARERKLREALVEELMDRWEEESVGSSRQKAEAYIEREVLP